MHDLADLEHGGDRHRDAQPAAAKARAVTTRARYLHCPGWPRPTGTKMIAENRRARYEYQLLERLEAGIVLTGTEVKSLREGRVTLAQAYADVRDMEVWLIGAEIAEYGHGNIANHDPGRDRKLLLKRAEISSLVGKVREKGQTIVPTRLYFKDGKVKVELALARGKERADKRRDIADRDAKRQMERALKAPRPLTDRSAHDHDARLEHVAVALVEAADRLVSHFVRRLQRRVAVRLRPGDLRSLQCPGDRARGALASHPSGRGTPARGSRGGGQLRVAEHLAVLDGDEHGARIVARALHVAREPFLERPDVALLLARDVHGRFARRPPMPGASSGRSAHVTISIPVGGAGSGISASVRSRTSRELRPAS